MATSGSKTIAVTSWDNLVFSWSAASQSVANNSTTVSWSLKLVSTSSGRIESTAQKDWKVTVNGTSYSGTNTVGIGNNSTKTLASGSTVIKHDADGTKTFSYSFSQEFGITFSGSSIGTITGSGSGTLNTIPRKSTPTLSASTIEMGKTVTIYTNRASSSFTHKLYYGWYGTTWYSIATGVTTSYTWTIPLTFANNIPDSTKGWGTIRCETYSGSTLIGTADVTFTATVPASMKPTCTVTVTDPTGHATTYGNPVKGLSKFKVVVTPTISYNSAIKTYSTTANGVKYTAASFTTGVLKSSGTLTVSATVTDKRGRTGSASKSLTVLNYNAPSISKLTVARCDSDGTANEQGAYVKVTFSATVTALNNKNTATYTLKYKKSADTSYTTVSLSDIANSYSVTNKTKIFAADTGSSYDVEVTVKDNHSTTTRITSASTAFTLMHFGADGTSVAVGKVSEKSNTMEVGLNAEFYGSTMQAGNSYAFQPEAFSGEKGYTLLAVITLNTLNVNAPIVFKINRRGALCPMQVYVRFASSSTSTDPDLASITYEGDNYGAFMIKSATSTWKLYVDNTNGWSNPCLQEWFTTENQKSRLTVTFPSEQIAELPDPYYRATPAKMQSLLDYIYPVNSVYISYSHVSPATLFGGTWVRITNAFLWAVDASGSIGLTGGEKTHKLTTAEMPSHSHGAVYSGNASGTKNLPWLSTGVLGTGDKLAYSAIATGESAAHNNMPPYIQVSVWRRTA